MNRRKHDYWKNFWAKTLLDNLINSSAFWHILTLSTIYTHFSTLKKKALGKTLWKKVKLLILSNFTIFHNVFYAICILKSFISHISVVICSVFEFEKISECCIGQWVNDLLQANVDQIRFNRLCSLIFDSFSLKSP